MADEFDYVIVGGGSAGAVVAARLSEDPNASVCVLEWGPTDVGNDDVLQIRRWLGLLEGPLDLAYHTTLQPRGNAHIVHSRAKVLGGLLVAQHDDLVQAVPGRLERLGRPGLRGLVERRDGPVLRPHPGPARPGRRGRPQRDPLRLDRGLRLGARRAGRTSTGTRPRTATVPASSTSATTPRHGVRSSSSVMYLHPVLHRSNLSIQTESRAMRIETSGGRATAVEVLRDSGARDRIAARKEIIVAAGSVDTPRLLLYSGIGPRKELEKFGIDVVTRPAGRGREPDRPSRVDHPLEAAQGRWGPRAPWTRTARCSSTGSASTTGPT